ncbi:MAG: MFS transporter [Chlamydiota bacterium]
MKSSDLCFRKTKAALLWTSLLNEPFLALYALMPFILRKDLEATLFQISLFTMLKPTVSLLSFYWSSWIACRKDRLRSNLIGAGILARLPFLIVPFIDNVWYLIFAGAAYMLFSRAGIPAWMEILKLNMPKKPREKLFSVSQSLGFAEGILIALALGMLLDTYSSFWKILFMLGGLLGIFSTLIQGRLPIRGENGNEESLKKYVRPDLFTPWKEALQLMRERPDFARFQWGFMAGGGGYMLIIPALALYYADVLPLSHTDMALGRCLFMGLGYVISSPCWGLAMNRFEFSRLTSFVCVGFGLFPLLILCASLSLFWFFLAFFLWGVVQAGSHLLWNLSGTIYAGADDSSRYTSVNILTVGLRGLVAPMLGGVLCDLMGPVPVFFIGAAACMVGGWHLIHFHRVRSVIEK